MPDLHKTLILANMVHRDGHVVIEELAFTTEHAPFRHRREQKEVGGQRKRQRQDMGDVTITQVS